MVPRMTNTPSIEVLPVDEAFAAPAPAERIDRTTEALVANGFIVHVVDTVADARRLVTELLPADKLIFTATSETLRVSGLAADIDESDRFRSARAEQATWDYATQGDDLRRHRAAPDVMVGSVHAVTEDGQLVAASFSGSQLAPYASGAAQVVWVVGAQKIVPDLPSALRRIERYSYPLEDERMQRAYGIRSAVSKILIINREIVPGRGTVVLIRETVGF
jgi:hypothetical protein